MCDVLKATCVRCSAAFGAGVGVGGFSFHLYFCMFLLSVLWGGCASFFCNCEIGYLAIFRGELNQKRKSFHGVDIHTTVNYHSINMGWKLQSNISTSIN